MKQLKGTAKRIFGGLQNQLSKLARFGQSKHDAKQLARDAYIKTHGSLKGYNPARVEGIFSLGTMQTYLAAMEPFASWCAAHEIKNAGQITESLAAAYLKERKQSGLSAWTVSRDMAAINEVLGFDLSKKELGLRQRNKTEITRSRIPTTNDGRRFSKYADQLTIAKATEIRRASMTRITASDCVRNHNGLVFGIRVVKKGGKERVAPVLNAYKEQVTAIVDKAMDAFKPLFTAYDSHIDNHHFRTECCAAVLRQLEQEQTQGKPWFGGDLNTQNYIYENGYLQNAQRKAIIRTLLQQEIGSDYIGLVQTVGLLGLRAEPRRLRPAAGRPLRATLASPIPNCTVFAVIKTTSELVVFSDPRGDITC